MSEEGTGRRKTMSVAREKIVDPRKGLNPTADTLRLLQVLEERGREAVAATQEAYERAQLLAFSEYTEAFRRVEEFLSFCSVVENRVEDMEDEVRQAVMRDVERVKIRCYGMLLKAMGAYLLWMERRGMVNFFAEAVFIFQLATLEEFRKNELSSARPEDLPDYLESLQAEVEGRLKRLIDKSVEIQDFRF